MVFTIQFIIYPIEIVPFGAVEGFDRGFLRVRFEGVGFMTLSGLHALNKYLVKHDRKYILYYILCLSFVFMLGFRSLLLTYLVSTVVTVYLCNGMSFRTIISISVLSLLALFSLNFDFVLGFISEAIELTNSQFEQGEEYIRFQTFNFLFNEVNYNFITILFGNGFPYHNSDYGVYVLGVGSGLMGYIAADLGLIGMSFYYGVFSTLVFVFMFVIVIFYQLDKQYVYIKGFFIYLIISSFTTAEIFRSGMFGVEMLALYLSTLGIKRLHRD